MKTSILFLALFLPVYLFAQLNGNYTIGGDNPDFSTIGAAAAALQTQGVDGPVTLSIRDGVYEEQVQLNGIPGASALNPVVFQGESQDSSTVIWEWLDGSIIDNYVFYGENLSFLYFKHLTMRRPTTGNNGRIVLVLGYADGVFFENCALIGSTGANNFQEDLVLASYCPLIDFKQCRFENGYEGISSAGEFNGPFEGAIHVDACTFVNQREAGVFGIFIDHVWVTNSTFLSQNINGSVGVLIEDTDNASTITGNSFYYDNTILSGNTAIEMDGQTPTPSPSLIANNMIAMFGGNGASSGIRLIGIEAANVYFNTVRIRKTPGYECYAALVDNCVAVNLLNNNFVAEGSPTIGYFQGGVLLNDYNNFYTEPGVNWLTALMTGPNCHSVDPGFLDDTDLHVSVSDLADAGLPIANITTDFDGELRDPLMPDIGADEVQPFALDAGVLNFVAPIRYVPYCDGPPEFVVTLKNYGSTTLESATVLLEINEQVQAVVDWTGSLAYLEETTLNLGAFPLTDTENYNLRCYTQLPNSLADEFTNNDAAEFEAFHLPLSGTYTLGGTAPDFNSLTELNANLINAGLCGPTTILIRDGTYDDNIYVDTLPGSSAVNTLTITSESGDSSAVVITDEFPSPYEQLIYFDQVSYLTISHLTLDDDGADLKDLIRIRSGHDITISNCELIGYSCNGCAQATEKGLYALAIDSNLIIRNNFIYSNSDAFWIAGNLQSGMFTSVNFLIENNRVFNTVLILNAARPRLLNNRFSGRFSKIDNCEGFEIANNIFLGGFALFGSPSLNEPSLFYNNALSHFEPNGASVSWDWALFLNGTSNAHIYHNTMKGAFNAGAVGLYFSKELELFNNLFYQGEYNNNSLFYQSSSIGVLSDHNVFFRNDSLASILTTRQDLFQQDFNSYFIDPQFSAHPDSLFFPTSGLMNNLAVPLGLDEDLFFQARPADYPDVGAIEYETVPAVNLGPDRVLCAGTVLDALNPGSTYLWSDGSDGQTLTVLESGSYAVQVFNDLGTASDTVQIDIVPAPFLQLEDLQFCLGDTAMLFAGLPDLSYLWNTGDTTAWIQTTLPGTYTVTVTNAVDCSTTDSLLLSAYPTPEIQLLVEEESCPGAQDGSLTAIVSGGQGQYGYAWSGSPIQDSLLTDLGAGAYTLTLTDGGCSYTADTSLLSTGTLPEAVILNEAPACVFDAYALLNGSAGATSYTWWLDGTLISTAEAPIYSFPSVGTYTLELVASNGLCTDTATYVLEVQGMPDCGLCTPYYSEGTVNGDFIDGVVLNQLQNTQTGGTGLPSYHDYTDQQALLERGLSHELLLTSGATASNRYAVWLDYNASGSFEPEELLGEVLSTTPYTDHSLFLSIPADAAPEFVRLRIRCFEPDQEPDPCISTNYGETEDYTVKILLVDGVEEILQDSRLFPNPVQDYLYLTDPNLEAVSIWTVDGRLLLPWVDFQGQMDVRSLSAGLYLLKGRQADRVVCWKFVKG